MNNFTRHSKLAACFFLFAGLFFLSFNLEAQLSTNYRVNFSREKLPVIKGGTILAYGGGVGSVIDDTTFANIGIGFQFTFNGVNYTHVGISSNGFLWFGDSTGISTIYNPISSASPYDGAISAFGNNLTGQSSSSAIVVATQGSAPNRTFSVEWQQFVPDSDYSSTNNALDLFITLYECSGEIRIIDYSDSALWKGDSITGQVGMRGTTANDFVNININCISSTWLYPDTGTSNAAVVSIGKCFPGGTDSMGTTILYYPTNNPGLSISCNREPNSCYLTPQLIMVEGGGGFSPYTINWTFVTPDSTIDSGSVSNISFPFDVIDSFKTPGHASYNIIVTDSSGCVASCDQLDFDIDVCSNHVINEASLPNNDSLACQCSNFSIPYTSTGVFNGNNTFMVELSNSAGVFDSLPPVIGQLFTNKDTGVIAVTIPCSIAPGSGYKIRVISNSPPTTGADSTSSTFIIRKSDTASVEIAALDTIICPGGNATFIAVEDSGTSRPSFQWTINGMDVANPDAGNIFSVDSLSNGDKITVVLSLNGTCTQSSPDTSNTVTITVSGSAAPPKPIVNVRSTDSLVVSNVCSTCSLAWYNTADTNVLSRDSILVVSAGGNYYVSVMDTITGCSNVSDNVSIVFTGINAVTTGNGNSANEHLFIYPNPCAICNLNSNADPKDLFITDLLGRNIPVTFTRIDNGYVMEMTTNVTGFLFIQNRHTGEVVKFIRN